MVAGYRLQLACAVSKCWKLPPIYLSDVPEAYVGSALLNRGESPEGLSAKGRSPPASCIARRTIRR